MIHIITPCSRPENLLRMSKSIDMYCKDAEWHVCFDTSKIHPHVLLPIGIREISLNAISGGVSGNLQRNRMIDIIKANFPAEDWIFCLDDDNLLHPNFIKLSLNILKKYQDIRNASILTWDQELPGGEIRKGNDPRVCHIDQAQFMIRVGVQEHYIQQYEADGILIEDLIRKNPDSWLYLPETFSFYNRISWDN